MLTYQSASLLVYNRTNPLIIQRPPAIDAFDGADFAGRPQILRDPAPFRLINLVDLFRQ